MTSPRLRLASSAPVVLGGTIEGIASFAAPPADTDVTVSLAAVDLVHGTKIYRVLTTAPLAGTTAGDYAFALPVPLDACAPPEPYGPDDPIEDTGFVVTLRVARVGRAECGVRIASSAR